MMISPFQIYLLGVLNAVEKFVFGVLVGSTIATSMASLFMIISVVLEGKVPKILLKVLRLALVVFPISGVAWIFIPSAKTVAAMYVLPPLVNNQVVQEQFPELLKLQTQKWIDELCQEKGHKESGK